MLEKLSKREIIGCLSQLVSRLCAIHSRQTLEKHFECEIMDGTLDSSLDFIHALPMLRGQCVNISKCMRLEADADVSSARAAVKTGVLAIHVPKCVRHAEIKVNGVSEAEVVDGGASLSNDKSSS